MGFMSDIGDWFARISGGYHPPEASRDILKNVPFSKAARVGRSYTSRFASWDAEERARMKQAEEEARRTGTKVTISIDENNCQALLKFKDSTLFWDAKMALCTDGARRPEASGDRAHQKGTSYQFRPTIVDGKTIEESVDAEFVPYVVVPTYDDPEKAKTRREFSGSRESFVKSFDLQHGNLGVVIFGGKRAGVIFADEGSPRKIGEASIKVHELLRASPHPWTDARRTMLEDFGEDRSVLYFLFPGTTFNIDDFGPAPEAQRKMAEAISKRALDEFDRRFPPL